MPEKEQPVGDKIPIKDVLGKKIKICNCSVKKSQFGDGNYVDLQIEYPKGKKHRLQTGGSIIVEELSSLDPTDFPVYAKIDEVTSKAGRKYYSFEYLE